jgi:hypothetical protein
LPQEDCAASDDTGADASVDTGSTREAGAHDATTPHDASPGGDSAADAAPPCATTSTGGLPLTNLYMAASVFGMGGKAFSYEDMGGSTSCVNASSFCGMGMDVADPPPYLNFGGGIGVNVDQAMGSKTVSSYTPTGSGIFYTVTGLPTSGLRIQVDNDGVTYCAQLTAATGTVPWTDFSIDCFDAPPGAALTAAPLMSQVEFQVPSVATSATWDFCVTALRFAP